MTPQADPNVYTIHERPCPECGGQRIATYIEGQNTTHVGLYPYKQRKRLFWRAVRTPVVINGWTCIGCGLTTFYAEYPQSLLS